VAVGLVRCGGVWRETVGRTLSGGLIVTEPTSQQVKAQRMIAVREAIAKTAMPAAGLWNPWPSIVETGVSIDKLKAAAGGGKVPEVIPDGVTIDQIPTVRRILLGGVAKLGGAVTGDNIGEARSRLAKLYVQTGMANYAGLASGNCTLFACCVIGMLARQPAVLGPGVKVELFNLDDGDGNGHAYVVVGRAGADVAKPEGYGPDCFFIDQWYARHRATQPGVIPVKDPAATQDSTFHDPEFFQFIFSAAAIRPVLAFTSDQLPKLGV
jgi:hypothetical protein